MFKQSITYIYRLVLHYPNTQARARREAEEVERRERTRRGEDEPRFYAKGEDVPDR